MLNQLTGFKIAVIAPPDCPPLVIVPAAQVEDVRELFMRRGIDHAVGAERLPPTEAHDHRVIHVGTLWDRETVQDVLDSVQ